MSYQQPPGYPPPPPGGYPPPGYGPPGYGPQGYGPPPQWPQQGPPQPPKKKGTAGLAIGITLGVLVLIGMCRACDSFMPASKETAKVGATDRTPGETPRREERPAPPAEPDPIPVSARELHDAYEGNEVRADNLYKGKKLLVTGTVASIDKDFLDNIIISLATPNMFQSVRATMEKNQASQAANLSKGEAVNLVCVGGGAIIKSATLRKCRFN